MAGTKIDFSNVKELTAVEPGTYLCTFTKFEVKKGPKGQYVAAEFTISDDGEDNDFVGRKLYRNLSLTENSLWAFKQFLLSAGAEAEDLEGEMEIEDVMQDLIGNEVRVTTNLQEFDNVMRANVTKIAGPGF